MARLGIPVPMWLKIWLPLAKPSAFALTSLPEAISAWADQLDKTDGTKQISGLLQRPKGKAGRPKKNDPIKDRKLAEDWRVAKANGTKRKEFAESKGMTLGDLKKALDRVRNNTSKN